MKDKSLVVFFVVLFGVLGTAILLITWLGTVLESDKIAATFAGAAGLIVALVGTLRLKYSAARAVIEPVRVNVETEDKS